MKMFIECYLPMTKCNMRCSYCYVTRHNNFNETFCDLSKCIQSAEKAFSAERLGGICLFNICAAGETLLHPDLAELARIILKNGHYLMLVTNGTLTGKIKEYCDFEEELKERLFFKISLHYIELKRLNMLERFCDNVELIKKNGISYTIELTPDDSYIPYIDEIKNFCMKKFGALCHVTVPRDERKPDYPLMTNLSRNDFRRTWQVFDSALFDFKESIFEVPRKEFCYAGKWSIVLNLSSGEYYQCYKGRRLGNVFEKTNKKLKLIPIGNDCPEGHCFNGHAFLGFGLIPEIKSPTFSEMRNRNSIGGNNWVYKEMNSIMECRLESANKKCGFFQKIYINVENRLLEIESIISNKYRELLSGNRKN